MKIEKAKFAGLFVAAIMMGSISEAEVLVYDGFNLQGEVEGDAGVYRANKPLGQKPNSVVEGGKVIGFDAANPWVTPSKVIQAVKEGPKGGSAVSKRTSTTSVLRLERSFSKGMEGRQVVYASARIRMDLAYKGSYKAQAFLAFSKGAMQSSAGAGIGMMWNVEKGQWDLMVRYNKGKAAFVPVQKGIGSGDTGTFFVVWKMDSQSDRLDVWVNPKEVADLRKPATKSFTDFMGSVSKIENVCFFSRYLNGTSRRDGVGFYFDELILGENPEDIFSVQ